MGGDSSLAPSDDSPIEQPDPAEPDPQDPGDDPVDDPIDDPVEVPFEITFNEGQFSGWFGGDTRPDIGPRSLGIAQTIHVETPIHLQRFAFGFVSGFASAATGQGGVDVTLVLHVRDDAGVILRTREQAVPVSFAGGWVEWGDLDLEVEENRSLIFSAYLRGAYDTHQVNTGYAAGPAEASPGGTLYTKNGTGDADMEAWTGWAPQPGWSAHFRLQGVERD